MRKWLPLILLASAQFVMTLDSSVMNVSISQIVADLNTSIQGVQSAITLYTLVMASFMLAGAKLGDILGRNRVFALGLAVYGVGSLTTSLSPSLSVLLVGWSGVEGLGAVMVIPAIFALTAANYEGKDRALAYALIGATVAIAVAAGPLIGGWVTTNYSWRWVFAGETVVVIILLLFRSNLATVPRAEHPPKMDFGGAALSAAGLGLIVFGILMSSTWGLITPRSAPTIGGTEITPLGFSVVPVPDPRRHRISRRPGPLGGPPPAARTRPAGRHDPAPDPAASRRAADAAGSTAGPDGNVLRPARLSAGRARTGRVRDR